MLDVDRFIEEGYVHLPGAVAPQVAETVRRFAEELVVADGAPWQLGQATVYEVPAVVDAVRGTVWAAIDALLGTGRWMLASNWGFPTRFPGPIEPFWHVDGDWFHHRLTSSDQVLTPIFLWQDVGDDDGPTLLAPGSHRAVARLLAEHEPDGLAGDQIGPTVHRSLAITEQHPATGRAGDVYLCHPFLAHTINPTGPVARRVVSNTCVHGRGAIRLDGDLNAVERAIATR